MDRDLGLQWWLLSLVLRFDETLSRPWMSCLALSYSKIWTHLIPVPQRGEIAFPPKECNPSGCKWGGTAGFLLGYGASLYKSRP